MPLGLEPKAFRKAAPLGVGGPLDVLPRQDGARVLPELYARVVHRHVLHQPLRPWPVALPTQWVEDRVANPAAPVASHPLEERPHLECAPTGLAMLAAERVECGAAYTRFR